MNRPPIGPSVQLPYNAPRSASGTVGPYGASGGGRVRVNAVPIGWQGTGFDDAHDQLDALNNRVLCRVRVKLQSPKRLSVEEFKDLKGSLLYGRMFKNRIVVDLDASQLGAMAFMREIEEWAETTCGGFFCIDRRTLYFEKVTEAVAFHLRFDGQTEDVHVDQPGSPAW